MCDPCCKSLTPQYNALVSQQDVDPIQRKQPNNLLFKVANQCGYGLCGCNVTPCVCPKAKAGPCNCKAKSSGYPCHCSSCIGICKCGGRPIEPQRVVDKLTKQSPMMTCGKGIPTAWDMYPRLDAKEAGICDFSGGYGRCDKIGMRCGHVHPCACVTTNRKIWPACNDYVRATWLNPQQGTAMCDGIPPKQVPPTQDTYQHSETGRLGWHRTMFNYPAHLDARGDVIIVSERDSNRIQFLTPQGGSSRIRMYGTGGNLSRPGGVCLLQSTRLCVAVCDTGNGRLRFLKLKPDNTGYGDMKEIFTSGTDILGEPEGIYHDAVRKKIYVTDISPRDPKVTLHDIQGDVIRVFRPSSVNPFIRPTDIVCDEYGRAYVTDTGSNTVQVFDQNGDYLFQFGRRGNKEGEFEQPSGICKDRRGNIFVSDQLNNRIQMFSPSGEFMQHVTTDCYIPKGISETKHGLLAVCTGDPYAFLKFYYPYPRNY